MINIQEAGGGARHLSLAASLGELEAARSAVVDSWSQARLDLVAGVSDRILKTKGLAAGAGVVHFAYWTRRGALRKLAADHLARRPAGAIGRPRGLVFHLPPQNVETVFLYSWVISYLAGNANVTRLPTTLGADMSALLDLFLEAIAANGDRSQLFVRYAASDAIGRAISAVSDARLVWGGDAKIAVFAPYPLRNGGKALWFGDRRSVAILDGAALGALPTAGRRDLAERLHNDIFTFDQMACSSPQRIFVVGEEPSDRVATDALLDELSDVAVRRGSGPATGHVIRKMVGAMARAASGGVDRVTRHSNALTSLVAGPGLAVPDIGGGFLDIVHVRTLGDIHANLAENIQTVVHFGFAPEAVRLFAEAAPPFCVSRIAPVGQALDFDSIWEGYDLASELTAIRRVA